MPKSMIRTHDAELYVGWPTADTDDPSVQVGVRYGVDARWAVLTSPEQVADLRRQLQRASRAVWPMQPVPPPNPLLAGYAGDHLDEPAAVPPGDTVTIHQHLNVQSPGAELHTELMDAAFERMKGQPS